MIAPSKSVDTLYGIGDGAANNQQDSAHPARSHWGVVDGGSHEGLKGILHNAGNVVRQTARVLYLILGCQTDYQTHESR